MRFIEVNKLQLLLALVLCCCLPAQAQRITDPLLKNIVKNTLSTYEKKPFEKLYVQTDKPVYLQGDTMRLKAYLLNGDYRAPSALSGILYVALDNEAGKNIKRLMLPVGNGLAWADMALDTAVKQGNYTLRAYTNWMRNFGEDHIFKKKITVSGHQGNPVLASSSFKQTGKQVETALQFRMLDGRVMSFKDVELKLMSGKKNVSKDKFTTDPNGTVKLNFAMPDGNEPLSIKAMIAGNAELTIPVTLPRPENIDVQFMPEGGALAAGIPGKVGIKAIGEDGKGINVSGKLYNSKGEEVGTINTAYRGMGSFAFTPQTGESYTAKLNGISKAYLLPHINPAGTVLSINTKPDSLILHIQGTQSNNTNYYLIGQARGIVCYAEPVSFIGRPAIKSIATNLFPTGIARFTLINSAQQPVNERIVFINHKDELKFNIQSHKNDYTTRDSIALTVNVTDKNGKPVQGSFSMAVTDNSQVEVDSLGNNILTNLLLTSDLKGEIEQPGYYFAGNKDVELDNLMLTQGWVGYDWKELLSPETKLLTYQPEKEFVVSGKVTNAFGKPIEKSPIALLSNKPLVAMDTLSDNYGRFEFKNLWPVDTAIFKLQARNKNNKEFNVSITMDEQTFPAFKPDQFIPTPWYVNTDTTLLRNANSVIAEEKAKKEYKGEGTELRQVNITAKKIVKGSKNLNGPGEADLVLDEDDMKKAGKKTLTDLLREKIPGIIDIGGRWTRCNNQRPSDCIIPMAYVLYNKKISFLFDGIDIDKFYSPKSNNDRWSYIKNYLDYYTAEDVRGIELMFQSKYNTVYAGTAVSMPDGTGFKTDSDDAFDSHVYIEITTRTGHGPFMKVTPGTYLYKPLAFTLPRQFYSPKYTVNNKNTAIATDMRSTIFWEPNMITDASGKATVSFYSADKAANYSVIMEGTDMRGGLGYGKKAIILK